MVKNLKGPNEILCDCKETVTKFSYLRDRFLIKVGEKQRQQLEQQLVE